ncbi:MAG TPA: type II CAAX endopeptidase family protein [Pyrinomonadaceae bacterium]
MGTPPIQNPTHNFEETPRWPEGQQRPEPTPTAAPDPDNPPWGVLAGLGLVLLSFLLMALTQAAFLVPYALRRGVAMTPEALGEFALKDPGAIFVEVISIIPAHLVTLALAWALVTRFGRFPFLRTLGWRWGGGLTFWRSAGLAVALLGVGMLIVWLTGPTDNALERLIQSSRGAALATAFAATFTAPIVEEILFRGVLYSPLRRMAGASAAAIFVVLLFALIHVPQYWPSYGVIGTILLLSAVLTAIRARAGNLLPCFVVHFVFNSIQAVLIVLNPYIEGLSPEKTAPAPGLFVELFARICGA